MSKFDCKFISYYIKTSVRRNAFEVLMNRAREIVLPEEIVHPTGKTLCGTRLYIMMFVIG